MNRVVLASGILAFAVLAACAPPPTPVVVTLTPPVPTSTPGPLALLPALESGASFLYSDGATLLAIPHGEFVMGFGTADNPAHRVILSDYWLYATEVTNSQYALCVAQGWCSPPDALDNPAYESLSDSQLPVVGVTYDQAAAYCGFMGGDLPTEAQWEKAARSDDSRKFPWGSAEPSCDLANYAACGTPADDVLSREVGASPYGALNTAGNVYEWVSDWFDPLYYESSPAGDPLGPVDGRSRVIRSSSYHSSPDQLVTYARSFADPGQHRPDLGFRCAISQPDRFAPACQLAPTVTGESMGGAAVSCPDISIDVQVTACRYGGGAIVTFDNSLEHDLSASFGGIVGCTLLSGTPGTYPISYACRRASTAIMTSRCAYVGLPPGQCGGGYALDPASQLCQWNGARTSGIDCPGGEFYDPVSHCCSVEGGDPASFPVCPVGSSFTRIDSGGLACLPHDFVVAAPAVSEPVNPPVCGDLCELTVELCSIRNLVFCPTTCSCLAVGRKCPEP